MTFPEVLLRLGCALVAWMVIYTHGIWAATLTVTDCSVAGDALWRLLLGFAPFTLGFSALLGVTAKLPEVHRLLAWLALPLIVLVPVALLAIWPVLTSVTFGDQTICAGASVWQRWWAPVQLTTLGVVSIAAARVWLARRRD